MATPLHNPIPSHEVKERINEVPIVVSIKSNSITGLNMKSRLASSFVEVKKILQA